MRENQKKPRGKKRFWNVKGWEQEKPSISPQERKGEQMGDQRADARLLRERGEDKGKNSF